ncbi:MAG: hypothetical protein ACXW07_09630, partial [Nitrososphaeraceae archaeon]
TIESSVVIVVVFSNWSIEVLFICAKILVNDVLKIMRLKLIYFSFVILNITFYFNISYRCYFFEN